AADPEFGTGALMVCTFGDKDDVQLVQKHGATVIRAIDTEGLMTDAAGPYKGLAAPKARERIKDDLRAASLLTGSGTIRQRVGVCWRCQTPVEYIITPQWFLKIVEHKERFLEIQKKIAWYPEHMRVRLENWIESLNWDWCISRQRYFATPVPVWECSGCGEVVPAEARQCYVEPTVDDPPQADCPKCHGALTGSSDVFDTWFDSSITPLVNARWKTNDELFRKLFPMDLRPQAHDIIRTWVFYTLARSVLLTGQAPFRDVAISGFILAPDGRPMHTSWGNVVDPLEVVEKLGADPLRYYAARCGLGVDTAFDWNSTKHGSDLCVKLWNISRFVASHIESFEPEEDYTVMDRWILSELSELIGGVTAAYDAYGFDKGLRLIEHFAWHRLADNYLEIVKHRIYDHNSDTARHVLYRILLSILKMLSPILPHITEELYQRIFREREGTETIHLTRWPTFEFRDEEATEAAETGLRLISLLRNFKSQHRIGLSAPVASVVVVTPPDRHVQRVLPEVQGTLRIEKIELEEGEQLSARFPDESP
ncbi:MAG: class I tRNA ligase family protein, partial [Phycisphaerae bacterium]